jgi:hypothetical protein
LLAKLNHADFATFEAMPRVIGVLPVFAHHDLHDFVRWIMGETLGDIGWATITRQNPAKIEDHRINLAA